MSNPGLQQHHPRQQSSHSQPDIAGGPPTSHPTGHEATAHAGTILDQGGVIAPSVTTTAGDNLGDVQHNGDSTSTSGVRTETGYEGDGIRTVTNIVGEDKSVSSVIR